MKPSNFLPLYLAYCLSLICSVFVTSPPGAAFGWNMLFLSKDVGNRLCHVGQAEALKGDRNKQQFIQSDMFLIL